MALIVIGLWAAANVADTLAKGRQKLSKAESNLFFAGMGASMLVSALLTWRISDASTVSGAYAHYVIGVRLSSGAMTGMAAFVCWVLIGALMNLSAMGIAHLIRKRLDRR